MQDQPHFATLEHDRYVRTVIRTITSQVQVETGKAIDENVMMIGDEWFYMGLVQTYGSPSNAGRGLSIGQPFTIQPVGKYGLKQQIPISKIINDFCGQIKKFALIPENENRLQELKELGDVVDEQEFSFRVRTSKHDISVYRMRNARHVISDKDKLPNGDLVGWTDFPQ